MRLIELIWNLLYYVTITRGFTTIRWEDNKVLKVIFVISIKIAFIKFPFFLKKEVGHLLPYSVHLHGLRACVTN